MRRPIRSALALFVGTLVLAVASAGVAFMPDQTPEYTAGATLEALAAMPVGSFEQ